MVRSSGEDPEVISARPRNDEIDPQTDPPLCPVQVQKLKIFEASLLTSKKKWVLLRERGRKPDQDALRRGKNGRQGAGPSFVPDNPLGIGYSAARGCGAPPARWRPMARRNLEGQRVCRPVTGAAVGPSDWLSTEGRLLARGLAPW